MRVMVMGTIVVMMVVVMIMMVIIVSLLTPTGDLDVGGRQPGANHPRRTNLMINAQGTKRATELVERQSGIEQRAKHHVAGDAGKTIEIDDARHYRREPFKSEQ